MEVFNSNSVQLFVSYGTFTEADIFQKYFFFFFLQEKHMTSDSASWLRKQKYK